MNCVKSQVWELKKLAILEVILVIKLGLRVDYREYLFD